MKRFINKIYLPICFSCLYFYCAFHKDKTDFIINCNFQLNKNMYYFIYLLSNFLYTLNVCWDHKLFPQIEFTLPTLLIALFQNKSHHPKILSCKYLYHYSLTHFYLRYTTTAMNFTDVQPFLTCFKKGNHPHTLFSSHYNTISLICRKP